VFRRLAGLLVIAALVCSPFTLVAQGKSKGNSGNSQGNGNSNNNNSNNSNNNSSNNSNNGSGNGGGGGGTGGAVNALNSGSSWQWNGCGGNDFVTCVNIQASIDVNAVLTLVVKNTANTLPSALSNVRFTQIGLFNLPNGAGIGGSNVFVNGAPHPTNGSATLTSWLIGTQGNGFSGAGIAGSKIFVDGVTGNVGVMSGQTQTFVFAISGLSSNFSLSNNINFALHGQGGPNGCSTKLVVTNGVANQGPFNPGCFGNVSTVPEPLTMGLVATGLVAMAAAGALKRRRDRTNQ